MEGEGALENLRNPSSTGPIATAMPSWKLYDNPFYYHRHHHPHHHHHNFLYNSIHLPLSVRKLAASLWDLAALFHPMDHPRDAATASELHLARAHIKELKAELEFERRLRKKAEALSKALAREASEERARREAGERACEGLAAEASRAREEAVELRRAVEEERRMMRVAEALREERVHMKLAEARLLMEEKLLELRSSSSATRADGRGFEEEGPATVAPPIAVEDDGDGDAGCDGGPAGQQQRKEAENHHIRRGIRGYVEFPKGVRARLGSVSGPRERKADPGPKLECQMAQLRVLLRHRIPASSGAVNQLVM